MPIAHPLEISSPAHGRGQEQPPAAKDLIATQRRLLSRLNHEVRTPMTGILGMADLLLETELSEEQRQYVNSTRHCAEMLLESISNTLEYATVTTTGLDLTEAAFHLPDMLRSTIASRLPGARSHGVEIHAVLDEDLPEIVVGDGFRFGQVLGLLLSHAVKSSRQGEIHVVISASVADTHQARVLATVTDLGPELTAEALESLFEAPGIGGYDQARKELGLPLAYEIVRRLGGTLRAESLAGEGTMLTAEFEFALRERRPQERAAALAEGGDRHHILVVEDNDVAQRFMKTVLERKGYRVTIAAGGPEALAAAAKDDFDCVLMDVQMPGMDGFETTRRLRRLPAARQLPIIACTANTSPEVRNECVASGMDDFLAKPLQINEMLEVVSKNIRLWHGTAS